MGWNLPDDWASHYRNCGKCGRRFHASDGACDYCLEAAERKLSLAWEKNKNKNIPEGGKEIIMTIINLTPHAINVHTPAGVRNFAPSGEVARVASTNVRGVDVDGIPTVLTCLGGVTGLPDQVDGVVLIVSGMVASAAPRDDVFSPGDLVRDDNGRPIGCSGLRRSK